MQIFFSDSAMRYFSIVSKRSSALTPSLRRWQSSAKDRDLGVQRARLEGGGHQHHGFLWTEIMDENWPLFAARISGRSPTENEVRLLEASHRLWPSALASVKSKLSESPALQAEARSLTTEVWKPNVLSVPAPTRGLRRQHLR
jgi:hypothetical protein